MAAEQTQGTVLITGASGLIGTRICEHLKGHFNLVGMDLKSPGDDALPLDHFDTDLTSDQSVAESLENIAQQHGNHLVSVLHLAAYYDFSGEPSPLYDQLTVEGTRRLLRQLRTLQFECEQFVFSSSLLVMKPSKEGKEINESSPTQAEWAYPQSKLKAEEAIRQERGDIPCVMLRIAGVYDSRCHSLPVGQQIARIYEKQLESYLYPGDSTHGQALVHLDDLAACFHDTITHRKELDPVEVFLIAEPDVMSYREIQERVGELVHGKEWPTIRIPKVVARAGAWVQNQFADEDDPQFIKPWMIDLADAHYAPNIARARQKLRWNPQFRLRDTLPAMIDFLKEDPEAFYRENKLPLPAHLHSS